MARYSIEMYTRSRPVIWEVWDNRLRVFVAGDTAPGVGRAWLQATRAVLTQYATSFLLHRMRSIVRRSR